jgi:hypothetical protein
MSWRLQGIDGKMRLILYEPDFEDYFRSHHGLRRFGERRGNHNGKACARGIGKVALATSRQQSLGKGLSRSVVPSAPYTPISLAGG